MILDDLDQRKKLSELEKKSFERQGVWQDDNPFVNGISDNSNNIRPGYIFFAINGYKVHGAKFSINAVERGANIIVTDLEGTKIIRGLGVKVSIIVTTNVRKKLGEYASLWHGVQPKMQIAVTGTNGKTSVCCFTQQIWELLGYQSASIGTLGVQGALQFNSKITTLDPINLHKVLRKLAQRKVNFVSLEASSHGLDQFRLDEVNLKAAAFTNLSRDHLDYHIDEDEYFAAKCLLFERVLSDGQLVVVNIDDPHSQVIKLVSESKGHKVLTVGTKDKADFRICEHRFDLDGQTFKVQYKGDMHVIRLPLVGDFQAINALTAAALVIGLGESSKKVFHLLPQMTSIPGRMELVGTKKFGARVYVDYAHTPGALSSALKALRPHTMGKLVLVFGAGGERDIGKRSLMGNVANSLADNVFITDDNPRNEPPSSIRSEILSHCSNGVEIPDRAEAILTAIDRVQDGDVLLIAGKGHESGQVIGDDVLPFNDKEFVSMSLALLDGRNV